MKTAREFDEKILAIHVELDERHKELDKLAVDAAKAENVYRLAKATAYLQAEGRTVDEKKSRQEIATDAERLAAHTSKAVMVATIERIRSLRAQLSSIQTLSAGARVELETLSGPQPQWSKDSGFGNPSPLEPEDIAEFIDTQPEPGDAGIPF